MTSPSSVDNAINAWLAQRSLKDSSPNARRTAYSIAIESPCIVCQPRVAIALAEYLNEFDDCSHNSTWIPITDHHLEQLQRHSDFRKILGHDKADDPSTATSYLSQQGGVILELPKCHAETGSNPHVFQVSMSCQEPEHSNHHLWINAKRIPPETLIPMIANAFLDWAHHEGEHCE